MLLVHICMHGREEQTLFINGANMEMEPCAQERIRGCGREYVCMCVSTYRHVVSSLMWKRHADIN